MTQVTIAEVRSHLDQYLRLVRRGAVVRVMDGDTAVAEIVPIARPAKDRRRSAAKRRLKLVASSWSEIVQYDATKAVAAALLAKHPLRAADSLQLAAALVARESLGHPREFVTLDARLAAVAENEGFQVLMLSATAPPPRETQDS